MYNYYTYIFIVSSVTVSDEIIRTQSSYQYFIEWLETVVSRSLKFPDDEENVVVQIYRKF